VDYGRDAGDAEDSGHTGEKREDSFCAGREKRRYEKLQRRAHKKRNWSYQNEGRRIHAFMLSAQPLGLM